MHGATILIPLPPPPVLLTHNYPPSNVDRRASQNTVAQIETTITEIDTEMDRLRSAKLELQRVQDQHKSVISPMRRVPGELIAKIMEHVMPEYDRETPTQNTRAACVLASVCSRWRDTAIATPQLWTIIGCYDSYRQPHDRKRCGLLVQMSLSRSGDLTVAVCIDCTGTTTGEDHILPNIIAAYLHRIGRLVFLEPSMIDKMVLGLPAPRLRKLVLRELTTYSLLKILRFYPLLEDVRVTISQTISLRIRQEA